MSKQTYLLKNYLLNFFILKAKETEGSNLPFAGSLLYRLIKDSTAGPGRRQELGTPWVAGTQGLDPAPAASREGGIGTGTQEPHPTWNMAAPNGGFPSYPAHTVTFSFSFYFLLNVVLAPLVYILHDLWVIWHVDNLLSFTDNVTPRKCLRRSRWQNTESDTPG